MNEILRAIRYDETFPIEGEVHLRFFDAWTLFLANEEATLEYVEACARYFDALPAEIVDELCRASIRYCNRYLEDIGEPPRKFTAPRDVLTLIEPVSLIVPTPRDGNEPVAHLELRAEWEGEHALEWIVRGEKVVYVGQFTDEDPFGGYVAQPWNFA